MTQRDSNPWPLRCRCSALTNWAMKSHSWEQVNLLGSCFPWKECSIKEVLYEVRCLKSTEDMILALAGQFKQLFHFSYLSNYFILVAEIGMIFSFYRSAVCPTGGESRLVVPHAKFQRCIQTNLWWAVALRRTHYETKGRDICHFSRTKPGSVKACQWYCNWWISMWMWCECLWSSQFFLALLK